MHLTREDLSRPRRASSPSRACSARADPYPRIWMRDEKTSRDMTVLEHLAELRVVLLQSILAMDARCDRRMVRVRECD
jgi:hypothetical protein